MSTNTFPGFAYTASELTSYLVTGNIFIVSVYNDAIIRYIPADGDAFGRWLHAHNITDLTGVVGKYLLEFYATLPADSPLYTPHCGGVN